MASTLEWTLFNLPLLNLLFTSFTQPSYRCFSTVSFFIFSYRSVRIFLQPICLCHFSIFSPICSCHFSFFTTDSFVPFFSVCFLYFYLIVAQSLVCHLMKSLYSKRRGIFPQNFSTYYNLYRPIHIYIYIYISIYICICIYVYIYTYKYVYI